MFLFFSFWKAFLDFYQDHWLYLHEILIGMLTSTTENIPLLGMGRCSVVAIDFLYQTKAIGYMFVVCFVLFFSSCWFCYPSFLKLLLMEKIYITFSLYFLFEMDTYCIVKASKMKKWIFLDIWHIFSQPLYICQLFCLCYKFLLLDFLENIWKEIS